jgi:anti-anti-sigma factor
VVPAIVATDVEEGIVAVELSGDADLALQGALTEAIRTALNRDAHLILDVSDATFMDAAVIRSLVHGYHEAAAQGSACILQLGTAAIVERVVKLSGIEDAVPRARTRAEAVGMIRARAIGHDDTMPATSATP